MTLFLNNLDCARYIFGLQFIRCSITLGPLGQAHGWGRNIINLLFADDTDALAEEEQELEALNESLDITCTRYQMEIRAEKTKLMTKSANGIHREIKVKKQKLDTVTSFNYL